MNNLCQFLPQEQVQNFSRLNDKQLLTSTMNAVGKISIPHSNSIFFFIFLFFFQGNPQREEDFNTLKKLQHQFGQVSNSQEKDEEEVRKLREENARFENEVKNYREVTIKALEK